MNVLTLTPVLVAVLLLAGCDSQPANKGATETKPPSAENTAGAAETKTVDVVAGDKGFVPNRVEVNKGEKLQLKFRRTSDGTCAKDVVFPELDLKKPLPLNEVVTIDVPTDRSRTLAFQCGMGMYKSAVVVN